MKLSIIICVYNMEDYIDRCLSSVVGQTFADFEVILINDGSTDGTLEKCRNWEKEDSRIRVVTKDNEGLGISRNRGIHMASGEYLAFLDADDWLEDEFVEMMLDGTQNGKNDIVICDMRYVEIKRKCEQCKVSSVRLPKGTVKIEKEKFLLSRARTFMCAKVIKRKLFVENNLVLPAHAFEDISTVPYLIAKASNIYYVHRAMYNYWRNREGSIVNDFSQLYFTIVSLEELLDRFIQDRIFENYRLALANLYWGQVCHIWNVTRGKFSDSDENALRRLREECVENFCRFFPEGDVLQRSRYYVDGSHVLYDSIKHIVLSDEQIVNEKSRADYLIMSNNNEGFQSYVEKEQNVLLVNIDLSKDDEENASWNIADEIIEMLLKSQ